MTSFSDKWLAFCWSMDTVSNPTVVIRMSNLPSNSRHESPTDWRWAPITRAVIPYTPKFTLSHLVDDRSAAVAGHSRISIVRDLFGRQWSQLLFSCCLTCVEQRRRHLMRVVINLPVALGRVKAWYWVDIAYRWAVLDPSFNWMIYCLFIARKHSCFPLALIPVKLRVIWKVTLGKERTRLVS